MSNWMDGATADELRDGAVWLQDDARGLYVAADQYRDTPGKEWLAIVVQQNAAHSAAAAREAIQRETLMRRGAA